MTRAPVATALRTYINCYRIWNTEGMGDGYGEKAGQGEVSGLRVSGA